MATIADDDQHKLLADIRDLSKKIHEYQHKFETGAYHTYGGALALQKLKRKRRALQSKLTRIHLIKAA